jgi:hypothetical protein
MPQCDTIFPFFLIRAELVGGIGVGGEDEVGCSKELGVEVFAEAADEGGAKELVDADSLAAAFFEGVATDVPMVDVKGERTIGEFLDADRIEGAGDGLGEGATAVEVAALDCAQAVAVFPEGIGTLLGAGDERGDDVALEVDFVEALGLGGGATGGGHKRRVSRVIPLQKPDLGFVQRGAAVADDATLALADLIVTREILGKDVLRHEAVADLDDGSETVP